MIANGVCSSTASDKQTHPASLHMATAEVDVVAMHPVRVPPLALGNDPLDPHRLSLNNGIVQGDYFIGPPLPPINPTPVRNITEYLAKRENSDEFVTLKVLSMSVAEETRHGRSLLHNEHQILSLLQDQPGVIHHHGLFKEQARVILVLDCLIAHEYDPSRQYVDYVNLQHYVIKEKKLKEKEALELFCGVLATVETLHKVCIGRECILYVTVLC